MHFMVPVVYFYWSSYFHLLLYLHPDFKQIRSDVWFPHERVLKSRVHIHKQATRVRIPVSRVKYGRLAWRPLWSGVIKNSLWLFKCRLCFSPGRDSPCITCQHLSLPLFLLITVAQELLAPRRPTREDNQKGGLFQMRTKDSATLSTTDSSPEASQRIGREGSKRESNYWMRKFASKTKGRV